MMRLIDRLGGLDKARILLGSDVQIGGLPEAPPNRTFGYRFHTDWTKLPIEILGKYGAAVGGADTLRFDGANDFIMGYILNHAHERHIIIEGFMISCSPRYWEELYPKFPHLGIHSQYLFLNTPWDECLRRFTARRNGEMNAATEKATEQKFRQINKHFERMMEVGISPRWIPSDLGVEDFLIDLLRESEKCSSI